MLFRSITTAKELRKTNQKVKIIFLTSSTEFTIDSYTVQATNYFLKPVTAATLYLVLDDLFEQLSAETNDSIIVKTVTGQMTIHLNKLIYCDTHPKTISYHLTSGKIIEGTSRPTYQEQALLIHPNFVKLQPSFILNMDYIDCLTPKEIVLSNQKVITLPRGAHAQLNKTYIDYYAKGGL